MPIRIRVAVLFTLIALAATAIGGLFLVMQLQRGLTSSLDQSLTAQWAQVQQAMGSAIGLENFQDSGGTVVGSNQSARTSNFPPQTEYVVQIIDQHYRLIDSNQAAGSVALLAPGQVRLAEHHAIALTILIPDGRSIRVIAGPAVAGGSRVLLIGASLDTIARSVATVRHDLLIGGIVTVLVIMIGSYSLASTALGPVERLRRQVEDISAQHTDVVLRVPRTNDEIAALANTMNLLLERVHRALTTQRSFVADAGHELRTPFAILQAELELASRPGRSRAELEEAIDNAAREAHRLSRLAEDLLLLARSDEGATPLTLVRASVRGIAERSAAVQGARAQNAGVELVVSGPDFEATVDPDRIRQVVDNLIDNSLRYAPRDSTVDIHVVASVKDATTWIQISVADRGPGFPSTFLPVAFERFQRPDDGRSRDDGGTRLRPRHRQVDRGEPSRRGFGGES